MRSQNMSGRQTRLLDTRTTEASGPLLGLLQGSYSQALYGGPNRVPKETLRLIWPQLLEPHSVLEEVLARTGVCFWTAAAPLLPFYAPIDTDAANPHGALWLHAEVPLAIQSAASHAWVEITHCPQDNDISEEIEARCNELKAMRHNGTKRPPINGRLAFQCTHIANKRGSWAWRFGSMWFYVASGSGVSINVGRTRVFLDYGTAENFLRRALRNEPLPRGRCAAADVNSSSGLASELDSIQILEHDNEWFSGEPRHELILLRHAECEPLVDAAGLPRPSLNLRCGRDPFLSQCATTNGALRRISTCTKGAASIHPAVRPHMRGCRKEDRARCIRVRNGSAYKYLCPHANQSMD